MTDINVNEVHKSLESLRSEVELMAPNKEIISKCNSLLEAHEEKSAKLVADLASARQAAEALEEKYNSLEADLKRGSFASSQEEEVSKLEAKSLDAFLRKGKDNMSGEELKYLRTDSGPDGGYLVNDGFETDIAKNITEVSDLRRYATVRTVGFKTTKLPIRTGLLTSGWVGEGQSDSKSNSTYGQDLLTLKKIQVTVDVTHEELQDASIDVQNMIQADVAEEFARIEGAGFVNGAATPTQPEGFMTNSSVGEINSGSATALTADSLISVTGEIKTGYVGMYGFNRLTRAVIRQMKDGAGQYLWQVGNLAGGVPNSLNGYQYIELPDMPDIAGNAYPVIFADFKNYIIGDGRGMTVIRDDYTSKRSGKIEYTFFKRVTGLVRKPEAFKKIKISA